MCHFWVQNAPFALNKKSLVKIIKITSICIFVLFSVQNFKKILRVDPELWVWAIFGSKLVHLPQTRSLWEKLLILFPSTYWTLSLSKIKKDSYNGSRVMKMYHFGPKMGLFAQTKFIFSEKPCSYHSCPCTSQKLNSDINLLMTYWRLKNTEISLADNLRILFFRGMQFFPEC